MFRRLLAIGSMLFAFRVAASADPLLVTIDPGETGTAFTYQNFDFSTLGNCAQRPGPRRLTLCMLGTGPRWNAPAETKVS